jgi:hypothetical protein
MLEVNNKWFSLGVMRDVIVDCKDYDDGIMFKFWKGELGIERFLSEICIDSMNGRDMLVWLDSYVDMVNDKFEVEFGDSECKEMKWRYEGKLDKDDLK